MIATLAGARAAVSAGARGRMALRAAHAARLPAGAHPRLRKLVHGLASDLGVEAPELWTLPQREPNALAVRRPRPSIGVSAGLIETYTRTELEAVVASCLMRLKGRPRERGSGPVSETELDRRAASLTRYPPALAAAIAKAKPATGPYAPFWFVAEQEGGTEPSARIAELLEL